MSEPQSNERLTEAKLMLLDCSPDTVERLDRIKGYTDDNSHHEVVRKALRLYEWIVKTQKNGFEFGVVKDNELVEIVKFLW